MSLPGTFHSVGNLYDAAKFALSRKNCSQKGYALSHGSRKKRRVGYHVTVPSGNLLVHLPPPITSPLSDCVERCVQLLGLRVKHPVHLVKDIPDFIDGFLKRSKWGWPGLDCARLSNCIDKLVELAEPTDLFILQGHHTDMNTSRHCCCIRNRLLCCPSDGIWRPLSRKAFDDLFIDRIEDIYMKRNPDIVSVVDTEESKPVAPEKGKLKRSIDDLDLEGQEAKPGIDIRLQRSNILRIKCIDGKLFMLHKKDNQWKEYSRAEVDGLKGLVSDNETLHNAGEFAMAKNNCSKRGYPFIVDTTSVQACVLLLGLSAHRAVYTVKDVPHAVSEFLKPSKWGWPDLDCRGLSNCIDKVIELALPTDLFILQGYHTKSNISRYGCCIKNRMLCCPSDGIWRPLCKQSFDDLCIDRIEDIYMKRNPDIVSVVDTEESKPVAPEKGKLKPIGE